MNRKTGAVLVLVGTFVLGGLAGAVLNYIYRNQVIPSTTKEFQSARPPGDIVEDMAKSLKLDDGQRQELIHIFEQSRERYRALSLQFRPQYDALQRETDDQIRKILREDQVALFDRLLKEGRERHKLPASKAGDRGIGEKPPAMQLPPRGGK
jgi:hypothetical protein